jgi:hypothetical protein
MRNLSAAPWTERHGSVAIEQSNTNNSAQGCGFLRMVGREKRAHQKRSLLGELFIHSNMSLFFQRPQVVALLFLMVVIGLTG